MPEAYAASIERLRALAGTSRDPDGRVLAVVAEYLRRDGRLDEAAQAVRGLIEQHPDFASAHAVWAQVQTDQGDLEGARASVTRLLELDRHNTRAVTITQSLNAADEAAALDWARAQGVGPAVEVEDEVVTITLGELYLEQGATDRAAEVARQLLALDGSNDQARGLLDRAKAVASGSPLPVEELAPEVDSGLAREVDSEIDSEVDLATVPIGDLAPDAVPVADLAPDVVPVASLAPDAVPVAQLAPETVSIAELAPPVAAIAALAPDPSVPSASDPVSADAGPSEDAEPARSGDEEDLDDFMSWLDET